MKEATSSAKILRIDIPCKNSPFLLEMQKEDRLKPYNRMKNDHRCICACYFSSKIDPWSPFCQCQIMGGTMNASSACAFSSYFQSSSAYL